MTIQERANKLYEYEHKARLDLNQTLGLWDAMFTLDELKILWQECKEDLDIGYDDEVYNILDAKGYFNN
jgi:hypothetical protein